MESKKKSLRQEEVSKNIFGLLSFYIFVASFLLINFLKLIGKVFSFSPALLLSLCCIAYGLSIISEFIYLSINKRNKDIDLKASGSELGFAGMAFSVLMILFEIANYIGI